MDNLELKFIDKIIKVNKYKNNIHFNNNSQYSYTIKYFKLKEFNEIYKNDFIKLEYVNEDLYIQCINFKSNVLKSELIDELKRNGYISKHY